MRVIGDRILGLLLPRASAEACACDPFCWCDDNYNVKWCNTCNCDVFLSCYVCCP